MAVTAALPGVTISVVAEDRVLQEYPDVEVKDNKNTTTRYIEAVSGQTFSLEFEVTKETPMLGTYLAFHVFVDGTEVDELGLDTGHIRLYGDKGISQGRYLHGGLLQRYCFTDLNIGTRRFQTARLQCEIHCSLAPSRSQRPCQQGFDVQAERAWDHKNRGSSQE